MYIYKIAIVNPIFLGRGIFTNLVGGILPKCQKNITFLVNDIGLKQIEWNCSKDKNRNKRHAIHGSLEKSL